MHVNPNRKAAEQQHRHDAWNADSGSHDVWNADAGSQPLSEASALALADLPDEALPGLLEAAAARRDRHWGPRLTFSPKVFLPLTNLCRNRCDYCSFRRSPGDPGEWTMSPQEVEEWLERAHESGCIEALFCLGDTPETAFSSHRRTLAGYGHESTVDYLDESGRLALKYGLLPHTNAGVLSRADMIRLREVNVSLGLMLENISPRLCQRGMPHHKAPDKRPEVRLRMTREAGELKIPFTSGLLIGIGETRLERVQTLLAIRELHRSYGHIQEVIIQNFRARPGIVMEGKPEPEELEVARTIALARLILDDEVSVQAPPNLNAASTELLIRSGINDFGGISPLSPDYINPRHPWPHLEHLADLCARQSFTLKPRLPIYDRYLEHPDFLAPGLRDFVRNARERCDNVPIAHSAAPGPWTITPSKPAACGGCP